MASSNPFINNIGNIAKISYRDDVDWGTALSIWASETGLNMQTLGDKVSEFSNYVKGKVYDSSGNLVSSEASQASPASVSAAGTAGKPDYSALMSYDDYFSMGGYAEALSAIKAAIAAEVEQAVSGLSSRMSSVNVSSDELARQAYISYMKSKNTLPQSMSANGYTGGLADSALLNLDLSLQNSRSDIESRRIKSLDELSEAIASAQLSGASELARSSSDINLSAAQAWQDYIRSESDRIYNDYLRSQESAKAAAKAEADSAKAEAAAAADAEQTEYARKLALAKLAAEYGDLSGLEALGIDTSAYKSAVSSSGGSSAASSGASGAKPSAVSASNSAPGSDYYDRLTALFNGMYESGSPSAYLSAFYKDYGIAYSGIASVYEDYLRWVKEQSPDSGSTASSGFSNDQYKAYQTILSALKDRWVTHGQDPLDFIAIMTHNNPSMYTDLIGKELFERLKAELESYDQADKMSDMLKQALAKADSGKWLLLKYRAGELSEAEYRYLSEKVSSVLEAYD